MPLPQVRFRATVAGKEYEFAYDMRCVRAVQALPLEQKTKVSLIGAEEKGVELLSPADKNEAVVLLAWCMSHSDANPPTYLEFSRLWPEEFYAISGQMFPAIDAANGGALGKHQAAVGQPAGASESRVSGIGGDSSCKPSTVSRSRRRNSGGSRRSSTP